MMTEHTHLKLLGSDACHVHEHDSRVDSSLAVVRVACKAVIPGDSRLLVLRRHGRYVAAIKLREKVPYRFYWLQEQDVCVHVE